MSIYKIWRLFYYLLKIGIIIDFNEKDYKVSSIKKNNIKALSKYNKKVTKKLQKIENTNLEDLTKKCFKKIMQKVTSK